MTTPRFAPVAPLHGLLELAKAGPDVLGTYQLLIAPIVLRNSYPFARFFYERPDQTIIIDNGVIELGYPLDVGDLAKAATVVRAQNNRVVVVMPDTIDDGKYTAKQVRHGLKEFRKIDHRTETLGVVQGTTLEECLTCARSHVEAGVDWLAAPRGLTKNLGSRVPLVQSLGHEYGLPIHVLGFSDWMDDDIKAAAAHRTVMGFDAATPLWCPEFLPALPPILPSYSLGLGRRPGMFWEQPVSERAASNVVNVRRWLSDAVAARTAREGLAATTDQ